MPPSKKRSERRSKQTKQTSSLRSTAALFANKEIEHETDPQDLTKDNENKDAVRGSTKLEGEQAAQGGPVGEEEAATTVLEALQDYVTAGFLICKVVQILVLVYIVEVVYFYKPDLFWKWANPVLFNVFGLFVSIFITFKLQWTKHFQNSELFEMPVLPEFNHILAVFIPTSACIFMDLPLAIPNLALNYFAGDTVHPLGKALSAFTFYLMHKTEEDVSMVQMVQIIASFFFLQYLFGLINKGGDSLPTQVSEEVIEEDDTVDLDLVQKKQVNSHSEYKSGNNRTLGNAEINILCSVVVNLLYGVKLDQYTLPLIILQKLIISIVVTFLALFPIFKYYTTYRRSPVLSWVIVLVFVGAFVFLTNYQLEPVLENKNAISWLIDFILESQERVRLLYTWLGILAVTIPIVFLFPNKISLNSRRKIWHYVLLLMVAYPGLPQEPKFVLIALFGATAVFIIMETIRYNKFTVVGEWLFDRLIVFQDFKDLKGPLNLSYIFLITGVSIPAALDYCVGHAISYKAYSGIVGLGIGDSVASIVGKRYGTIKWKGGTKSVQGTVAFVISTLIGFAVVDKFCLGDSVENWEGVFVSCILGGVLEGVSTLNDNLLIPCVVYLSLQLLENV